MNVLKYTKKDNKILIMMHVQSLTSRMDTSIYIGSGLQLLCQTINAWVDTPSSKKTIEGISSQVYILSG